MTDDAIKELIAQGVADALAEYKTNKSSRNGDDSHDSGSGERKQVPTARLTQWFEKMESVFHISNGTVACQIKFVTCTLLGSALTWWNSHVKTVGHDAAYRMPWKTLMKMLTENYTERFQELVLMYGRMFPEESDHVVHAFAERQVENKRKLNNNSSDNNAQQPPFKRQNVDRAYSVGPSKKKEYAGTLPLCNKCKFHLNGPCNVKCANCKGLVPL
ncbi:hypothetical protein Tco_0324947 [Tanacetum coccineum]